MDEMAALRERVAGLAEVGLEGSGAETAAAALDEVADSLDALMQRAEGLAGDA